MAKKKKTKVGNLISKATNAVKNAVSNAVKSGGLAASATKVTPAQQKQQVTAINSYIQSNGSLNQAQQKNIKTLVPAAVVNKSKSSNKTTTSNYPGLSGNVPAGISFGSSPVDIGRAVSSGGITLSNKSSGGKSTSLNRATAPTSADEVLSASRTGSVSLGGSGTSGFSGSGSTSATTMGVGSTAGANATTAGIETANDLSLEQKRSEAQLLADAEAKEKTSLLDKFFKKQEQEPTREELRQDYEREFDIKARTAEINSLQQDLDKVMNEIANQEAVAADKLGTNNFINNQISQIRRNAEPIVNRLSSEIKWKSGLLAEDRALMNEAIADALADSKSRLDNAKFFFQENSDIITGKYKAAMEEYIRDEERAYDEKQAVAEYARDVVLAYAKEGIRINIKPTDSMEDITMKISQSPFPQKSSGSGGDSGGYDFSSTQLNVGAVNSGLTLSEFVKLPGDVQNFYVSSSAKDVGDMNNLLRSARNGSLPKGVSFEDELGTFNLSTEARQYFQGQAPTTTSASSPKKSFWDTITSSISGIFK